MSAFSSAIINKEEQKSEQQSWLTIFSLPLLPLLKVNILDGRRRCLFVRPSKVRVEYNMNITILFHRRFAAGTLLFSTHKVSSYTDLLLSECLPHKMLEGGFRRPLQASAHPNQHYLSDITVCAQLNFFLFHPIRVLLVIGIFFEMEGGETKYARLLLLGAPTVTDSFRCASTFGPSTQYKYIYRSHVHIFE